MKEFRFRIIIVLLALALSLYLLYPTYVDYKNSKEISEILESKRNELLQSSPNLTKAELDLRLASVEDSVKNADPSIEKNRLKRVKLGLDLQGGMRVVLEVNTATLLEKLARNPDEIFNQVLAEAKEEALLSDESVVEIASRKLQERGIRLSRYFGNVREDDSEIISRLNSQAEDAVTRAMEIIRNRIDQYGVSEPSIQRQGARRIIVELPGVAREEEAKQLLQGTALLEFRLVREPEFTIDLMQRVDNALAGKDLTEINETDTVSTDVDTADLTTDTTQLASDTSAQQELTEEEWLKEHPFFAVVRIDPQGTNAYVLARDRDRLQRMLSLPEVKRVMPDNVEFLFSAKTFTAEDGSVFHNLFLTNKTPELTGGVITDARANIDPNTSAPIVNMEMNSEGATDWARITGANIQKKCAIVLDGLVFSAPVINQKITGGRSQISGMDNMEEAKLLEIVLKAGALPAPVDIIEERTVGPSLGQDSVENGLKSIMIGYVLVGIFMIFYYKKAGGMAAASLTFTILFILGVLAGFSATLTLPGIAGIVLTIGMALDANILIFERIREEIATGKTIKASIDSGFAKAFSAIIDSNITTFFTGIILYQFGTGPIQGFALTLMIGIVASLFSALVIVRLVFDYLVFRGTKISIG